MAAARDGAHDVVMVSDRDERWEEAINYAGHSQQLWWQLYGGNAQTDSSRLTGRSGAIRTLGESVQRLGPTDATVLIMGESGTGKERVAEALHSAAGKGNFVALSCAAIPKDLMESVKLSNIICRILGSPPPEGFIYELFLDENGEKISKSKGNGITLDEWLRYASPDSLSLYMYQNPTRAKRLFFDVIPKAADEYFTFLSKYADQDEAQRLENPLYHIHGGKVPEYEMPITFGLLINLVGTAQTSDKELLWRFISRYKPGASAKTYPELDNLLEFAVHYYKDFIAPTKKMRAPTEQEKQALMELAAGLEKMAEDLPSDEYQTLVFDIGKKYNYENLRDWFKALYEILVGQPQGPRMGTFIKLFGNKGMCELLYKVTK